MGYFRVYLGFFHVFVEFSMKVKLKKYLWKKKGVVNTQSFPSVFI